MYGMKDFPTITVCNETQVRRALLI